jgi:hypothetical protein
VLSDEHGIAQGLDIWARARARRAGTEVSEDEVLVLGVVYVTEAFQAVFCGNRVKLESTSE